MAVLPRMLMWFCYFFSVVVSLCLGGKRDLSYFWMVQKPLLIQQFQTTRQYQSTVYMQIIMYKKVKSIFFKTYNIVFVIFWN